MTLMPKPTPKPIQKNLRVPRDMAPLIDAEAKKQGVSATTWMLAVLAAAVGYKLPEK
jgi:predicted HicB family RNase H-like nuclease